MLKQASVLVFLVTSVLVAAASALSGTQSFRVRDDCDAATFNAAIGPGTCDARFGGGTTFQRFIDELTEDQEVGSWRFNPDKVGMDRGQRSMFESRGGEFHTFTRVAEFGGGIVPLLNDLTGAGGTRPECGVADTLAPPSPTNVFVPAGAAFPGPTAGSAELPKGTTKWQCCIHPWMQSTVTVK